MKEESHTERSVVTSRGQLVIPAVLRRKLEIEAGTQVVIWESEGRLILQPITGTFVKRLRGSLKGSLRVEQDQDAQRAINDEEISVGHIGYSGILGR